MKEDTKGFLDKLFDSVEKRDDLFWDGGECTEITNGSISVFILRGDLRKQIRAGLSHSEIKVTPLKEKSVSTTDRYRQILETNFNRIAGRFASVFPRGGQK